MSVATPPTLPLTGLCDAVCGRKVSEIILEYKYFCEKPRLLVETVSYLYTHYCVRLMMGAN